MGKADAAVRNWLSDQRRVNFLKMWLTFWTGYNTIVTNTNNCSI